MIQFNAKDYPTTPGVYLMKNAKGRIIYVGKAKSLRKRLASYFRPAESLTPKTRAMVAKIAVIDTFATATEKEALLLEESLIKKHRPRYNIVLRDDKRYILFKLDKRSDYPRLSLTRRVERDGAVYYGPFTSAQAARQTLKIIGRVFPLRKCKDSVFRNRTRPCLYHYIGQCMAPCVNKVDREIYHSYVRQVEQLLSGRSGELVRSLEKEMLSLSERLEFEKAAGLRDQIAAIKRTVEQQFAVLPDSRDLDVVGLAEVAAGLSLSVVFVRTGRLLDRKLFFWPELSLDDGPEVVASFLAQFYGPTSYIPSRILLPYDLEDETEPLEDLLSERRAGQVRLAQPFGLAEKKLLELARINAMEGARTPRGTSVGAILAERLGLREEPSRIECVDISHLAGHATRAGMVVFEDGEPRKDAYRIYAFPELEGSGDDYLALASWARRRVESGPPWPELVLIDGGRGQLAAVERALAEAGADLELASIAKGERRAGELEDRIFRPGRKNPVALKPGSQELLFLQRMRDAAHNFVIGRQRAARSKKVLGSEILHLEGIGPKTARLLWDRFPSVEAMASASLDDIKAIPGLGGKRGETVHAAIRSLQQPAAAARQPAAAEGKGEDASGGRGE